MRWFLLVLIALNGCTTIPAVTVPLSQVGIAFTREGELGTFAEGYAGPATDREVTPDDPVRIASISKLVVAVGVMKLVERGRLDLDGDVSETLGWSLRNPCFPDRPITLRQLLSHTSSVRDGDDIYVIPLGETVRATMIRADAWDRAHAPGSGYFKYGNLNFPIVASMIERATGERFDLWMRREVLNPMRIDACYNWPTCSDEAVARAIVLTQHGKAVRDDLGGRRPACPVYANERDPCDLSTWRAGENGALFSPQGGLRISARGLARVGRMLLNRGTLDGVSILAPASVDALLHQEWLFDGTNGNTDHGFYCSYGLATQQIPSREYEIVVDGPDFRTLCKDDPGTEGATLIGHAGDAYGLRSGLWIDRARGIGVAYFVTGLPDDPPRGRSAFRAAEEAAFERALGLLHR